MQCTLQGAAVGKSARAVDNLRASGSRDNFLRFFTFFLCEVFTHMASVFKQSLSLKSNMIIIIVWLTTSLIILCNVNNG